MSPLTPEEVETRVDKLTELQKVVLTKVQASLALLLFREADLGRIVSAKAPLVVIIYCRSGVELKNQGYVL